MASSKTTLTIHIQLSWRTLFRVAFMRKFCPEIYDKFTKEFQVDESMIEVREERDETN